MSDYELLQHLRENHDRTPLHYPSNIQEAELDQIILRALSAADSEDLDENPEDEWW